MEVLKKILNIVIDIFIVLVVIVSAIIAVVSLTARENGVPNLFGYVPFSVQSDSMSPVFETGDLIVAHKVDRMTETNYKVGDIVTFWAQETDENGKVVDFLNTHRVIDVQDRFNTGTMVLYTKGDNNKDRDASFVVFNNVVAKWSSEGKDDGIRIKKVGAVLDFLRKPSGFFIAVLLPMAIFFIYELVRFITNFMNYNKEKQKEAALEAAKELIGDTSSDNSGLSEEQKAQAILEFLEKQKAEKAAVEEQSANSPPKEESAPQEESPQADETEQPAAESTEAVTDPEQEETVSEASED